MVSLPPGEFTMGSPENEPGRDSDEVEHAVKIGYGFAIGKFPITRKEFAQFVAATHYDATGEGCYALSGDGLRFQTYPRYSWQNPGFTQTDNDPVVCVSWKDAHAYIDWLSQKTKKQYRLLSEAEWEYAARAGTKWAHYWGADDDGVCKFANVADQRIRFLYPSWRIPNCNDNYLYTSPVGAFPPNGFGLYDMSGNVWQWIEDCYRDNYNDAPTDGSPRIDESCSTRLLRGSPWYLNQWSGRSAYRGWGTAIMRDYGMGFRVARNL
jgi:formylglycine-generating enzyme required for sulfatase activity